MDTPDEIFVEAARQLSADPAMCAEVNASYLFDLTGENGGLYHMILEPPQIDVGPGCIEGPDVTMTMLAKDFVELVQGRLSGPAAALSGRLKIRGDIRLVMRLQSLLSARRD